MNRIHNFSAGPGTLPLQVLEEARDELLSYKDAGASVIEISHRSKQYTEIAESASRLLIDLLALGDDWNVLFLQGGASMQFYQVPLNFLGPDHVADYADTGAWSEKAIKEARAVGRVHIAATSAAAGYSRIPDAEQWDCTADAAYLHYTSNNTIYGTQYHFRPPSAVPLVCDASSDFLCRPTDMNGHGLIYAGAQKNLGPAGVTVVLINDSFLEMRKKDLPSILDYGTHVSKLFNTPPVFAVYLVEKVLRWLSGLGGLEAMEKQNVDKASVLYERIDRNEFYRGNAATDSRSLMNVTFRLQDEDLEAEFVARASDAGLASLKGHRSAGGIRASIYNACSPLAVSALVSFMDEFERSNG